MGAPDLLQQLRDAGLTLEASDGKLIVTPRDRLTDALRLAIKAHKVALMAALTLVSPRADLPPDPDRYCWPHSTAMNTAEIDRFLARVETLHRKGIGLDVAETLGDAMVLRDRDPLDDRRSCIECANLERSGRCAAARAGRIAGAASNLEPVQAVLQRCEGFAPAAALGCGVTSGEKLSNNFGE